MIRNLIRSKTEKEEANANDSKQQEHSMKLETVQAPKLSTVNFLENPFVYYQDIFRYNWFAMTNTWYQNHRYIFPLQRKQGLDQKAIEGPGAKMGAMSQQVVVKQEPHAGYPPGYLLNPGHPRMLPLPAYLL